MKITLCKDIKKTASGEVSYWAARWTDSGGRRRSKALGRFDQLSEREAKKKLLRLENEFGQSPTKRDAVKAPTLAGLIEQYKQARQQVLAPKTIIKINEGFSYLLAYFGESRRIDTIAKIHAERFKTDLLSGKAKIPTSRKATMSRESANSHLRTAKTMFNWAVDMELIQANPFRKAVMNIKDSKEWHYVSLAEYTKIMEHTPQRLKLLIALCRLAGLRSGEAVNLRWSNIDWQKNRLLIVGCDEWQPKDRDQRIIPICPELQTILLEAYETAPEGQQKVIDAVYDGNLRRDFLAILCRAGLFKKTPEGKKVFFDKPIHSLRKSCLTDWAGKFPMHVVKEWAGHSSITTTQQFYLQVQDADYSKAATLSFWSELTEKLTENGKMTENEAKDENKKAL